MSEHRRLARLNSPQLGKIFLSHVSLVLMTSVFVGLFTSIEVAVAALVGGLIACIAHAYMAWQVFRFQGAKQSRHIAKAFSRGAQGRFAIVVSGFCLVFIGWPEVHALALLLAFMVFYALYIVVARRFIS